MNAPIQWAMPALMAQRKSVQRQLLARAKTNLCELDRQLSGQENCERLKIDGGWYCVMRVPVTKTDEELAIELLLSTSVLAHPGHFYDFPRDGYLILSLIGPEADFAEGLRRVLARLNAQ